MTLEKAKEELEKFVRLKTTMRPAFVDVLLQAEYLPEHGHWDDSYAAIYDGRKGWCCSCCDGSVDKEWDYCPHCGAKMDEEVEYDDPRDLYGWERG